MTLPQIMQSPGGSLSISLAVGDDLYPLLKLFDETVTWLNARGLGDQWGSELFSTSIERHQQFLQWIEAGNFFVARFQRQRQIIGSLALSPAPPWYIAKRWPVFPATALYLEAFTISRSLSGLHLGQDLLKWAEDYTQLIGRTTIWLDCWADNPPLVRYYLQAGFTPHEIFMVHEWRGHLFEKQVGKRKTLSWW